MSVPVEKRCKACGTDVSQGRRAKDAAGNYLCEPCLSAARARQQAAGTATILPLAPANTCANCGSAVGALQQMWDWQGHQVCWPCRELLRFDAEERSRQPSATATLGGSDKLARPGLLPAVPSEGSPPVGSATSGVPAARSFLGRKVREYLIVSGLCLAGLVGIIVSLNAFDGGDGKEGGGRVGPDTLITVAWCSVLGGIGWYWTGGGTHCPSCNRRRARVLIGSENLGISRQNRTVHRRDKVRDASGSGHLLGTIERDEQVVVGQQAYAEAYRCKFCGHEWVERTTVAV